MAIESISRGGISLKLNAGTNGSGGIITRTVSLGKIMADADNDKIMSVVGALVPVLSHSLYRVEKTLVTVLEN